jgi:hypothetical protein
MPEERTKARARQDKAQGKAPSTQAGEFVREEIEHVREGKHGARSAKQAIAIGLSKARRAGVDLPPPSSGRASKRTRKSATRDSARGRSEPNPAPSARRSRATTAALERESSAAASPTALSRQGRSAARARSAAARSRAARNGVAAKSTRPKAEARKAAHKLRSATRKP